MKKGFTLIELLAVIVILAIIALIATPIVLNIINDAKESAILRSADFYIDALENEIMLENMKQGGNFNPNICTVTNKVITCDGKEINLKVDGEVPNSGSITFEEGKVTDVNLTYQNGTVTLDNKGELVLGENTENTVKTLKDLAVVSEKLGVNSIDTCATSGTCEPGTPFAIKVNDKKTYKFYVLDDSDNKLTLIMATNLYAEGDTTNPNVAWLSQSDYEAAGGGCAYTDVGCNSFGGYALYGPLTALKKLKERTKNWTNISQYSYELNYGCVENNSAECVEGKYSGEYVQNVRARMPKLTDLTSTGICNSSCLDWTLEGLYGTGDDNTSGYWLSDGELSDAYQVGTVLVSGVFSAGASVNDDTYNGIRPVITITKHD